MDSEKQIEHGSGLVEGGRASLITTSSVELSSFGPNYVFVLK